MMTDDERREVIERLRYMEKRERREMAARLRYVAEHGTPDWGGTAYCIAECVGEDDYPLWDSSSPLFAYLADLIEPEPERTCRNLGGEEDTNAEYYDFYCSECGYGGDVVDPAYCPGCGAKVVEE